MENTQRNHQVKKTFFGKDFQSIAIFFPMLLKKSQPNIIQLLCSSKNGLEFILYVLLDEGALNAGQFAVHLPCKIGPLGPGAAAGLP